MRKLSLKIEELHVESFDTAGVLAEKGTVRGHIRNDDAWGTWWWSCEYGPTEGTCIGPTYCCERSWDGTCKGTTCEDIYGCGPF